MVAPTISDALRPLAFLLGRWRGTGTGSYPTIEPFSYSEELVFEHVGEPYLLYSQESWDAITGEPVHFERGFLRPGADPGTIELVLAHPIGVTEVEPRPRGRDDPDAGGGSRGRGPDGDRAARVGASETLRHRRRRDDLHARHGDRRDRDDPPLGGRGAETAVNLKRLWLFACVAGLVGGAVLYLADQHAAADAVWAATTVLGGAPLIVDVVRSLARHELGVDVIAILAIGGCLGLEEYFAGAVLAVMLATGQALDAYAEGRAHRELSSLLARAPQQVHRYEDGALQTRSIDTVALGDRLFVKTGEVVPVDGVLEGDAVLDESALTGESRPVERPRGELVRSGAVNAGPAFDLRATATAADSTYAGIVRLVEAAEREKAPAVRLADRYAAWFIPITLVIAGGAWAATGDPLRALSVLVVATPCPLILAVPIAIVAGISRSAKRGIIVKGGGALETLARATVLLFDKTGTLTSGVPRLADVETFGDVGADELLRLAASLDQVSPHVLATAIVHAARERGGELTFPEDVDEQYGAGISGTVDGTTVTLGKATFVAGGRPLPAARARRPPAHDAGRFVLRVRRDRRGGRRRADRRRPDPTGLASRDPDTSPRGHPTRRHGHGRPSRRGRVGRRCARGGPDPVRACARTRRSRRSRPSARKAS